MKKMLKLHEKALELYIEMLQIHITTKTMDDTFHKNTERFYEVMFDCAHQIWERYVDLWGSLKEWSIEKLHKRANEIIVEMKKEIEKFNEEWKASFGTEDLLWTLANDLEDIEWTSKCFLKK